MIANAFALEPALELFDQASAPDPSWTIAPRPALRLVDGGAGIAPAPQSLAMLETHRRRRFLALVAVTVFVLGVAWASGVSIVSFGAGSPGAIANETPAVHVVLPGDSYGAIATELGVAKPVVAARYLRAANGGGDLIVGQRLVVDLDALHQAVAS